MLINTGSRTDIPACFHEWFYRRIEEGFVCMRNPYFPVQVTKYRLDPSVVDCLIFCTKNPAPMLPGLSALNDFGQYWFVTITPYGKEIEPFVPEKKEVIASFLALSERVGTGRICWRYDPVFLSETYPLAFHLSAFERMAAELSGFTNVCVISFIDLYEKTLRNFKGVKSVEGSVRRTIVKEFVKIGKKYGIRIKTCAEGAGYTVYGADCSGCLTKNVLEGALGETLNVPSVGRAREECECLLGNDIGSYNTCTNGCLYCYANYDSRIVAENRKQHDPYSPFLTGGPRPEDIVREAKQVSFRDGQLKLPFA